MNNSALLSMQSSEYRLFDRWLRRQVLSRLKGLQQVCLVINDAFGSTCLGDRNASLSASIDIHHPHCYRLLAFDGGLGAGDAYVRGMWGSNDLTSVIRVLARNRNVLARLDSGVARLTAPLHRLWQLMRRNSIAGSRRNIAAHYDLNNEFFRLFLDRRMMYSAALYENTGVSLEQAQDAKLDRICQQLGLNRSHHVLEIGTGWGGFAIYAARKYGCRMTTTTISQAQFEEAQASVKQAGLQDRITVLLQDYRHLQGQYDRVVSIEMIEAVGDDFINDYFSRVSELLNDDGLALIQAITIEDYRYQRALRNVDYIKRYIFPGSFIPSLQRLSAATAKTDLVIAGLFDMGQSYALTLREWRQRFNARIQQVFDLGFDLRFKRLWEYYLCYCEGGFRERAISNVQMLLAKPLARIPDQQSIDEAGYEIKHTPRQGVKAC